MRLYLMAGMAAGFGAVFGTPVAGGVFAIEVLTIGKLEWRALLLCLFAAALADAACRLWGIVHTHFPLTFHSGFGRWNLPSVEWLLLGKVSIAAVAFGLVSFCFVHFVEWVGDVFKRYIPRAPLRPVFGGIMVVLLFWAVGTSDFLGLGVSSNAPGAITLESFFESTEWHPWSWLWKLIFTATTLGSGFKGGEVTPLFFIGSALGNALSMPLHAPPDLFAALGFVAVFAGASNTPLACTLMGAELFGVEYFPYLLVACYLAKICSGRAGIYHSQQCVVRDRESGNAQTLSLKDLRRKK
jgi:H+/Cl- antiporter ClcA